MKQGITMFARVIVYLLGLTALAICFVLLPELAREEAVGKPIDPFITYLFLGIANLLALPFFIALYQTHKLLDYIDRNKAFSRKSIQILANIKYCSIVFSILTVLAVIAGISIGKSADPSEDVTFMVTLGGIAVFASTVVTISLAVLQKLLIDAVSLKSENDLII